MSTIRLEPTSPLRTVLSCASCLTALLWLPAPFLASAALAGEPQAQLLGWAAVMCLLTPVVLGSGWALKEFYFVDPNQRAVFYERRFLGWSRRHLIAEFEELTMLVEEPGRGQWCELSFFLRRGRKLHVHQMPKEPYEAVVTLGEKLARLTGAPFHPSSSGEQAGWSVIRRGSLPSELVLDPDTWREKLLGGLGCLPLAACLLPLWNFHFSPDSKLTSLASLIVLVSVGAPLLFLAANFEEYYLIDLKRQRVQFCRTFLGWATRTHLATFEDLTCLALQPARRTSRHNDWWEYGLTLYPRQGKPLPVVDAREQDYELVVEEGRRIAELMGLEFRADGPEKVLRVTKAGDLYFVDYQLDRGPVFLLAGIAFAVLGLTPLVFLVFLLLDSCH